MHESMCSVNLKQNFCVFGFCWRSSSLAVTIYRLLWRFLFVFAKIISPSSWIPIRIWHSFFRSQNTHNYMWVVCYKLTAGQKKVFTFNHNGAVTWCVHEYTRSVVCVAPFWLFYVHTPMMNWTKRFFFLSFHSIFPVNVRSATFNQKKTQIIIVTMGRMKTKRWLLYAQNRWTIYTWLNNTNSVIFFFLSFFIIIEMVLLCCCKYI